MMSQSSAIVATMDDEQMSPEGTQEGKNTSHLAAIRPQPLQTVSPENSGHENRGNWPQIAEVHIKGMISVTQILTSSHTQKSDTFLNLGCLVFFDSQASFDNQTTCPPLQNSPCLPPQSSSLRAT